MAITVSQAVDDVISEFARATSRFPAFRSAHEGYAIIKEELDELWEAIRKTKWDSPDIDMDHIREEAKQVSAMALRFMVDVT